MILRIKTFGAQETQKLAYILAKFCKKSLLFALEGELGSGKSTFTKGVAEALGIKDHVVSPSFTLMNEYEGEVCLLHVDLYRIGTEEEIHALGLEEYLDSFDAVVVEWAEKMGNLLDKNWWIIRFYFVKDNERIIEIVPSESTSYDELKNYLKDQGFHLLNEKA